MTHPAEREHATKLAGPLASMLDAVARDLHFNEPLHMHDAYEQTTCRYCLLRAGRALGGVAQHLDGAGSHTIEVREDGWTLQHSLACRAAGTLFDCPVNEACNKLMGMPAAPGRYEVEVDENGELLVGDEVAA